MALITAMGGLMFCFLLVIPAVEGFSNQDRVLLREIQAISLYRNRYTSSRRTSPVPQLKCTGGTAGCSAFVPEVVQCQNRGWDGYDIQWECKTDMDSSYRFGVIDVNCEGFDYPEDPYVLRGSCGLEYTLELTEAGQRKQKSSFGSGVFGSGFFQGSPGNANSRDSSDFNGAIVIIIFLALAYGVYKMFLCTPQHAHQPFADGAGYSDGTNGPGYDPSGPPPPGFRDQPNSPPGFMGPPPPGFKTDFTGGSAGYSGSSGAFGAGNTFGRHRPNANSGPGFWSGLGTGGVLGYLFGNRNTQRNYSPFGSAWGGTGGTSSMFGNTNTADYKPPGSSETRTASGFGGTKRR